jgi:hypothetical protein
LSDFFNSLLRGARNSKVTWAYLAMDQFEAEANMIVTAAPRVVFSIYSMQA